MLKLYRGSTPGVRKVIIMPLILTMLFLIVIFFPPHFMPDLHISALGSGESTIVESRLPKFNTYVNTIYGFSIDYPNYWQRVEFNRDNLIVSFVSNSVNESSLLENVALQVFGLPNNNNNTLKEIIAEEILTYKSGLLGFSILGTGPNVTHSGIPTYTLKYLHTDGKLRISTMEIFTIRGNEGYKIIFSADTTEYSKLLPIVEKMVDSFNFKSSETRLNLTHI